MGIGPCLELMVGAGIHHRTGSVLERLGQLSQDWPHKRRKQAHNKGRQGLANLVKQLLQPRHLGNGLADGAYDPVAKL